MSVPAEIRDGAMAYGSRVVTINSVTYIANNITIDRPSTEVTDNDENGHPARRREVAGLATITCELQLATSSTAYPKFGQVLTATFDANYGEENFVIKPVPHTETNDPGTIRVVNITGTQKIGTITTS